MSSFGTEIVKWAKMIMVRKILAEKFNADDELLTAVDRNINEQAIRTEATLKEKGMDDDGDNVGRRRADA